jgi:hypothetical protein
VVVFVIGQKPGCDRGEEEANPSAFDSRELIFGKETQENEFTPAEFKV